MRTHIVAFSRVVCHCKRWWSLTKVVFLSSRSHNLPSKVRRNGDARRHHSVKHTGLWLSSARGSRFNQSERRSSSVWWPITAKEHGPLSNTAPLTVFHLYQSFTARGQSFVHQTLAREDVLSNAGSHCKWVCRLIHACCDMSEMSGEFPLFSTTTVHDVRAINRSRWVIKATPGYKGVTYI